LNKKILSFIFGSLLVFSLFGAIEFGEVAAQSWGATVTSKTSGTAYFNSGSMPMNFDVKITYSSIDTTDKLYKIEIQAPVDYVFESNINIISKNYFSSFLQKAEIISPDPDDCAYFALALKLKCGIWSNDKDLKNQNIVNIYSTKDLLNIF